MLLDLYKLDLLKRTSELWYHVAVARGLLHRVRTTHQDTLPADSPAYLAIDPYIARRLPNFMPIRVTDLPPFEQIWDALDNFLAFWEQIGHLVSSPSLLRWEVSSTLYYTENVDTIYLRWQVPCSMPFTRSHQLRFIDRLCR